jgi:hypothetical protein
MVIVETIFTPPMTTLISFTAVVDPHIVTGSHTLSLMFDDRIVRKYTVRSGVNRHDLLPVAFHRQRIKDVDVRLVSTLPENALQISWN